MSDLPNIPTMNVLSNALSQANNAIDPEDLAQYDDFYTLDNNPNVNPVPMEALAALHEAHKKPDFYEQAVLKLKQLQDEIQTLSDNEKNHMLMHWYNLILSIQYLLFSTLTDLDITLYKNGINAILELKSGGFDKIQGVLLHAHDKWL